MSNGFQAFTYTEHAETRLVQRGVTKAQLEAALETTPVIRSSRGAFVAETALPGKDRLALKIVFSLPHPTRPHIVTVYYLSRKRTQSSEET